MTAIEAANVTARTNAYAFAPIDWVGGGANTNRKISVKVVHQTVRGAVPAVFPLIDGHHLDVMQREVIAGESTDIQSSGFDCHWIPALLAECMEDTRLVAIGLKLGCDLISCHGFQNLS